RQPTSPTRRRSGPPPTAGPPPRLPRMVLVPPPAEIVPRRTGRFRQLRPIGRVDVAPHTVTCAADQPRRGGCVSAPIRFAVHHPVVESGEHFYGVERFEFAGDTVGVGPRVRWGEVGVDRFDQLDELILSHRASPPELPQQKGDDDDRPDGEEQDRFPIERVGAAVVVPVSHRRPPSPGSAGTCRVRSRVAGESSAGQPPCPRTPPSGRCPPPHTRRAGKRRTPPHGDPPESRGPASATLSSSWGRSRGTEPGRRTATRQS